MSTDGSISNIQDGRDSESDVGVAIDILLGDLASSPDLIHTVASGSDLRVSHNHDTRHDGWQGDDRKGKAIDGPLDFTETVSTSDSDGQNNDADCTGIHASALTDRPDLAHPPTVGAVCHQVSNLPRGNRKRPITVTGDPIGTPHANDVLLGRGRMIANHPGNVLFRKLVKEKKQDYNMNHFKYEKGEDARQILEQVASLDPPGRFLEKSSVDGLWRDAPVAKAVEKACQALRDKKWDHPLAPASLSGSYDATLRKIAANDLTHDTVLSRASRLVPGHPNIHITPEVLRKRIRNGTCLAVNVPSTDTYVTGTVLKRLGPRLQMRTTNGSVLDIDLNKDKVRIDSRRLNLNGRFQNAHAQLEEFPTL